MFLLDFEPRIIFVLMMILDFMVIEESLFIFGAEFSRFVLFCFYLFCCTNWHV